MKIKTAWIIFIIALIATLTAFSIYDGKTEKEGEDKLVVAFGDSLTYGYGDEKGRGYIDTLEKKLNIQNREDYHFTNEAIYGLESSGILDQLADIRISSKLDEADYFLLFIGTNDLINSNGGNLANIDPESIEKGQEVYLQNLEAILDNLEESSSGAPILLLGLYNPYPDSNRIEAIIDEWNKEIIRLAKEDKKITYIPTNDLFKGKGKKEYFSDSLHLNSKGYNLVANRILERYPFQ
ncbi:GDSL-type esterase/lipase family protein [Bacillus sp. REN3]|uniref:GDSL-type esterase/lipase family protein n=1 Tax=Bacillus sp. REN3 TaxID=2802440 RepID=UPI001AEDF366|nr:GDSL-type esterase/lipase family protein [Bacillus sp. REN3]